MLAKKKKLTAIFVLLAVLTAWLPMPFAMAGGVSSPSHCASMEAGKTSNQMGHGQHGSIKSDDGQNGACQDCSHCGMCSGLTMFIVFGLAANPNVSPDLPLPGFNNTTPKHELRPPKNIA